MFNTSFIIDDGGKVILKYRKHNDAYAPVNTHPGDVYTQFVERYEEEPFLGDLSFRRISYTAETLRFAQSMPRAQRGVTRVPIIYRSW